MGIKKTDREEATRLRINRLRENLFLKRNAKCRSNVRAYDISHSRSRFQPAGLVFQNVH